MNVNSPTQVAYTAMDHEAAATVARFDRNGNGGIDIAATEYVRTEVIGQSVFTESAYTLAVVADGAGNKDGIATASEIATVMSVYDTGNQPGDVYVAVAGNGALEPNEAARFYAVFGSQHFYDRL